MIVNADDFGLDETANRGIAIAFDRGLISSTTLMANQAGFEEAVELAHQLRLDGHMGVHLVLTSGIPLTDAMRRSRRFCDSEGLFRNWRAAGNLWRVTPSERSALMGELGAQVERVRGARFRITHLDSHHHVHNEWIVGECVIAIARDMAIPWVRLARNSGSPAGLSRSIYKRAFNWRLRHRRLARTRWFGDIGDWLHLRSNGGDAASLDDFEVMTHPILDGQGRLMDADGGGDELAALLGPLAGSSLVSYAELRYEPGYG